MINEPFLHRKFVNLYIFFICNLASGCIVPSEPSGYLFLGVAFADD